MNGPDDGSIVPVHFEFVLARRKNHGRGIGRTGGDKVVLKISAGVRVAYETLIGSAPSVETGNTDTPNHTHRAHTIQPLKNGTGTLWEIRVDSIDITLCVIA